MISEFKQFLLRGNVIDLAVGVVIGAAFGTVVSSFVADILTPFIGALVQAPDFGSLSFTLNGSAFMYGNFLNALISFLMVAGAVFFFVVKPVNAVMNAARKPEAAAAPTTKECMECMGAIPMKARRCMHCAQPAA